jgi:hypothetical protein
MRSLYLFVTLIGFGCTTDVTYSSGECRLVIDSPSASLVESGEVLQIKGSPLTTHFDTAAYIGGVRSTVLDVDRSSCVECDACRAQEACGICSDCDACDSLCRDTCMEIATLVVPSLPPGPTRLEIYNSYGQSNPLDIQILHSPSGQPEQGLDTASGSTSDEDSGAEDSAQESDSGQDSGTSQEDDDTDTASGDGS